MISGDVAYYGERERAPDPLREGLYRAEGHLHGDLLPVLAYRREIQDGARVDKGTVPRIPVAGETGLVSLLEARGDQVLDAQLERLPG
jgi:hypothetical protein